MDSTTIELICKWKTDISKFENAKKFKCESSESFDEFKELVDRAIQLDCINDGYEPIISDEYEEIIGYRNLLLNVACDSNITQDKSTYLLQQKDKLDFSIKDCDNDKYFHYGNTPLIWAIANANNTIALEIIKAAPSETLDIPSKYNNNAAIHLIVAKGYGKFNSDGEELEVSNYQLLEALLGRGANPNIQNKFGYTALHLAIARRDEGFIKILLNHPEIDKSLTIKYIGDRKEFEDSELACIDICKKLNYGEVNEMLYCASRIFLINYFNWKTSKKKTLKILKL